TRIETEYKQLHTVYRQQAVAIANDRNNETLVQEFKTTQAELNNMRDSAKQYINRAAPAADNGDTNYIFLYFVQHNLPKGLVGLLFAIIFLASWGSISAALNSQATSSMMDIHLLNRKEELTETE